MTGATRLLAFAAMGLVGLAWGLSMPLSKVAVSTGYQHFGLIFWQLVVGAALLSVVNRARGRALPRGWPQWRTWIVLAFSGSLIPSVAFYSAVAHLPAGIMSIIISLVPVMAFPIALALGQDRLSVRRILGLLLGLSGTLMLVLPEASLPDPAMLAWVPIALIAPLCYAIEGNYVARFGTAGLDPFQVMWGASLVGAVLVLPAAIATGQFISPLRPFGAPETAIVTYAMISVLAYSGYVWLVGAAGAVFAVQVSYLVTAFGIVASWIFLGERYSPFIWLSLGLVMIGIFLVQPRRQQALAEAAPIGETARRVS
ncbi:MAG: EamA family transporter [Rhodobacteraceae bacterium]|nr:EamA family transporter [Paracoccaceae bacterium]QEW19191.1 carboxylate/amino acid/amine transporter [Marinibacterium anthonyi]|tara:strand:+ start:277 stop:1215 length:939 start_codon:yes stop_codon:yes gene_type:complete